MFDLQDVLLQSTGVLVDCYISEPHDNLSTTWFDKSEIGGGHWAVAANMAARYTRTTPARTVVERWCGVVVLEDVELLAKNYTTNKGDVHFMAGCCSGCQC